MGFWSSLFKAYNAPSPKSSAGYEAASVGRRLGNWQPSADSINSLLFNDSEMLRRRSRDLVRRNAWACNAVDAMVSNLIGTGIKPQSTYDNVEFKKSVHALWNEWTKDADAHGVAGFYGLQALAARALVEGGEIFVRLRNRPPSDGFVVPLQLQLLEPEHVPLWLDRNLPNGNRIRSGIEFDLIGRRVAYHMYREHPGDAVGTNDINIVRVPASEVLHLFRVLRPGQLRGEPWLSQALVKLHELDQYDDAELVRKKTTALIAGFITKPSPEFAVSGEDEDGSYDGTSDVTWSPGTMQVLLPGEDVKFSEPADLGGQYGEFMRVQLRAVAVAIGITYEQLTGDLTGVNYSSIRAGMVEFRRRMEQWQQSVIVHQLCRPVWARWMDQAVLSGALKASGYQKDRVLYQSVKWIPQGWQWVDPQKEINATVTAIRAGIMSRSAAIAANGHDAEVVDSEIAADNARADEFGLVFDTDPRADTKQTAAVDQVALQDAIDQQQQKG